MPREIPKNLTLRVALELLPQLGWTRRDMDGRHERWISHKGDKSLTLARTGKGGMNSPAPNYIKSMLRQELKAIA